MHENLRRNGLSDGPGTDAQLYSSPPLHLGFSDHGVSMVLVLVFPGGCQEQHQQLETEPLVVLTKSVSFALLLLCPSPCPPLPLTSSPPLATHSYHKNTIL